MLEIQRDLRKLDILTVRPRSRKRLYLVPVLIIYGREISGGRDVYGWYIRDLIDYPLRSQKNDDCQDRYSKQKKNERSLYKGENKLFSRPRLFGTQICSFFFYNSLTEIHSSSSCTMWYNIKRHSRVILPQKSEFVKWLYHSGSRSRAAPKSCARNQGFCPCCFL